MRFKNFLSFSIIPFIFGSAALLGVSTIEPPSAQAKPLEGTRDNKPVHRRPMTAEEFDRRHNWNRYQQMRELEQARQESRRCLNTSAQLFPTPGHAARYAAKVTGCAIWQQTGRRVPPGSPACHWGRYSVEQNRAMGFKPERGDCN